MIGVFSVTPCDGEGLEGHGIGITHAGGIASEEQACDALGRVGQQSLDKFGVVAAGQELGQQAHAILLVVQNQSLVRVAQVLSEQRCKFGLTVGLIDVEGAFQVNQSHALTRLLEHRLLHLPHAVAIVELQAVNPDDGHGSQHGQHSLDGLVGEHGARQLQQQDAAHQQHTGELPGPGIGHKNGKQHVHHDGDDEDGVLLEDSSNFAGIDKQGEHTDKERERHDGGTQQVGGDIPAHHESQHVRALEIGGCQSHQRRAHDVAANEHPALAGHALAVGQRVDQQTRRDADGEALLHGSCNQGKDTDEQYLGPRGRFIVLSDVLEHQQEQQTHGARPQVIGGCGDGADHHV